MPLTDLQIKRFSSGEKPYKRSDGGGLFIQVTPSGSKLWRMSYRFDGKQKLLSFGAYPYVTLASARKRRDNAKTLLAEGIDPMAVKKADKAKRIAETEHTFEKIAAELIEKQIKEGKAKTTIDKKKWLLEIAIADFGAKPIKDIDAPLILKTLKAVEAKGNYETAKRLRSTIGQVFRYAIATARVGIDPTYGLRGALIAPKVKHMAAITKWNEFAELVQEIWAYRGGNPSTRAAMKLMAILYPRPGELRLARWDEFDLDASKWSIPAFRTKMRRDHVKPLPKMAIDILVELRMQTENDELVFPSSFNRTKPISENTVNVGLRRLGFEAHQHTAHGFRATASSLLNESGEWDPDAIEAELGHLGADQVRRAYHRARYWEDRVRMCEWWANRILSCLN